MPQPQRIESVVLENDARWLAKHAQSLGRIRTYIPGETGSPKLPDVFVKVFVTQNPPGHRARLFLRSDDLNDFVTDPETGEVLDILVPVAVTS